MLPAMVAMFVVTAELFSLRASLSAWTVSRSSAAGWRAVRVARPANPSAVRVAMMPRIRAARRMRRP
jgi:hypothetical protein